MSRESFSFQGILVIPGQAKGIILMPERQSDTEMKQAVASLMTPFEEEKSFVAEQYRKNGLRPRFQYDNPFVNRGG